MIGSPTPTNVTCPPTTGGRSEKQYGFDEGFTLYWRDKLIHPPDILLVLV